MDAKPEKPAALNNFGRALILTLLGVVTALLEIVVFSWIAHFFGMQINAETLASNWLWLAAFLTLFIMPAFFFQLAFFSLFANHFSR